MLRFGSTRGRVSTLLRVTFLTALATACAAPRPADVIGMDAGPQVEPLVLVASARLPDFMPWYTRFAHHAWIDLRDADGVWRRVEVVGNPEAIFVSEIEQDEAMAGERWDRRVHVLAQLRGARAAEVGEQVLVLADSCRDYGQLVFELQEGGGFSGQVQPPLGRPYRQWPGPNSNTFIAWVVERTPGLHAELHHNAVGKDYPDGWRLGRTSAGWGVEVETAWLGAGVGLSQGVELHLLGLTAGIDAWPPALKLPFLPRLGFGY